MYKNHLIAAAIIFVIILIGFTDNIIIYKLLNPHVEGIVNEVGDGAIWIMTTDGSKENWKIRFDDKTKFYDSKSWRRISVDGLRIGDAIEAHGKHYLADHAEKGDFRASAILPMPGEYVC